MSTICRTKMTSAQKQILEAVTKSLTHEGINRFEYRSEYLGYLPFGQYHWIVCGGKDISNELLSEFASSDLKKLEELGEIKMIEKWVNPDDETESKTTYELNKKLAYQVGGHNSGGCAPSA